MGALFLFTDKSDLLVDYYFLSDQQFVNLRKISLNEKACISIFSINGYVKSRSTALPAC
jgi:hypothetical protein